MRKLTDIRGVSHPVSMKIALAHTLRRLANNLDPMPPDVDIIRSRARSNGRCLAVAVAET